MSLFIAPHNDDEGLFGCYTILREKPTVAIVTDGYIHLERFGIPVETRREESRQACKIMDVPVEFWGMKDNEVTYNKLIALFKAHKGDYKTVYLPAVEGGNKTHDLISEAGWTIWKDKCIFYSTYANNRLETAIVPTARELRIKQRVLACYKSQHSINAPHFEAVKGRPEFYE